MSENNYTTPPEVIGGDSVRLGRLQKLSVAAIRMAGLGGLTVYETATVTSFDQSAIQPRISELRAKGLVIASGHRRRNPSGKTATVWIACEYDNATLQAKSAATPKPRARYIAQCVPVV